MNWDKLVNTAHAANEADGIEVRAGKKYSTVAIRMDVFRRTFEDWGVETEIVSFSVVKGEPCLVKTTIKNTDGRVIATGHASEIVGAGSVNARHALENAETSSIGRALAACGIHGGEFASANEMESDLRNLRAPNKDWTDPNNPGLQTGVKGAIVPDDATDRERAAIFEQAIIDKFGDAKTDKGVDGVWKKNEGVIARLEADYNDIYQNILDAFTTRQKSLSEEDEAA